MNQLAPSPAKPLALRAPGARRRGVGQAGAHGQGQGREVDPAHPVCLTGLRPTTRDTTVAPLIVERRDQEFVEGLLADLGDTRQHASLLTATPARLGATMRVFQPLQRVFNMVVLEAFCDVPGQPRIDPKEIDSSGFVLRRIDGNRRLAWLKAGTKVFGWEVVDENLDPAHDRRASAVSLGHPALDALAPSQQKVRSAGSVRLAASPVPVSEDVQPLFVAPPDVCTGAGKTLLFGNLRVASGELTEGAAVAPAFGTDAAERDQLLAHLVNYLKPGPARELFAPPGKRSFTTEEFIQVAQATDTDPTPPFSRAAFDKLDRNLGLMLVQLNNEFDAFGTGAGALAMQAALKQLAVETDVAGRKTDPSDRGKTEVSGFGKAGKIHLPTHNAWDFLVAAKAVMLDAVPGASVTIPDRFGAVSADIGTAISEAMMACLQEQYGKVLPASGRFDAGRGGVDPQFVVRAFIRLEPEHPGCPGRLLWSPYSEAFTIAPWFESSGVPVPVIPLPDLMDREQLKRVRPTVAFALPAKLAALLQKNSAKDLADGKGKGVDNGGIGLGWICSFSLPIITLCAFIVLNIFLSLFNLIFFWLPFLKICIPIPKAKE
ncbi:MAG: hypothetical protein IPG93_04675 [Burkholderiales bacterium]|nr:hypothetical protein [Burkholderiales bacterium]